MYVGFNKLCSKSMHRWNPLCNKQGLHSEYFDGHVVLGNIVLSAQQIHT
jgi:hypothetical protein